MPPLQSMKGTVPPLNNHSINQSISHANNQPIKQAGYHSNSLGDRRRANRMLGICLTLLPLTLCTVYRYYRFSIKQSINRSVKQSIKESMKQSDISDLAMHFESIIEQHSGGPMSNACLHAAKSHVKHAINPNNSQLTDDGIVLFASGGWSQIPHSEVPLPIFESPVQREWSNQTSSQPNHQSEVQSVDRSAFYQRIYHSVRRRLGIDESTNQSFVKLLNPFAAMQSLTDSIIQSINKAIYPTPGPLLLSPAEIESLDLYWLARSLGQSRLYNTSFAVFLALSMQSTNHSDNDLSVFTYQGRAVRLLSLHIGTFVPPIKRPVIDIVCEIGSINQSKVHALSEALQTGLPFFSRSPDLNDPNDFAQVVDFGTQKIAKYVSENNSMPAYENSEIEDVIWHRQPYSWIRDQDVWISFEVAASQSSSESADQSNDQPNSESSNQSSSQSNKQSSGRQRYHLDLSAAQYGLHAEPHYQTNSQSVSATPYIASLQSNTQSEFNLLQFARPYPSAYKSSTILSPPPTPYIISEEDFLKQGGSIGQTINGTRAILDYAQRVLIDNDRYVNVEYSSFRKILNEACNERGISAKPLYHKKL